MRMGDSDALIYWRSLGCHMRMQQKADQDDQPFYRPTIALSRIQIVSVDYLPYWVAYTFQDEVGIQIVTEHTRQ